MSKDSPAATADMLPLSVLGDGKSTAESPEKAVEKKERYVALNNAINRLPERQRAALVLSKMNELDQKRIAEIMGIREGAVESLLSRAKDNLKKSLK